MEKEFVPYELAVKLKELGFDEPCLAAYYAFGDGKLRNGSYRQTESELFINGIGKELDDRMDELKMFAYHDVSVPTFSQAFRWFREKYNILATIYSNASGYLYEWHDAIGGTHRGWSEYEGPNDGGVWDTYEEAELACLNKLIEIVQGGQDNE